MIKRLLNIFQKGLFFKICASVNMYLCEYRYAEIRGAGVTNFCEMTDLRADIKICSSGRVGTSPNC